MSWSPKRETGYYYDKTVSPAEWSNLDRSGGDVGGIDGQYLYIYSTQGHELCINARELHALLTAHFGVQDHNPGEEREEI